MSAGAEQYCLALYVLRSVSIHLTVCVVFSLDAHNLKHSKEHKDDHIAMCKRILRLMQYWITYTQHCDALHECAAFRQNKSTCDQEESTLVHPHSKSLSITNEPFSQVQKNSMKFEVSQKHVVSITLNGRSFEQPVLFLELASWPNWAIDGECALVRVVTKNLMVTLV